VKLSEAKARMLRAVASADLHHGTDQRPELFVEAINALPDRTLFEQLAPEFRHMIEYALRDVDEPD